MRMRRLRKNPVRREVELIHLPKWLFLQILNHCNPLLLASSTLWSFKHFWLWLTVRSRLNLKSQFIDKVIHDRYLILTTCDALSILFYNFFIPFHSLLFQFIFKRVGCTHETDHSTHCFQTHLLLDHDVNIFFTEDCIFKSLNNAALQAKAQAQTFLHQRAHPRQMAFDSEITRIPRWGTSVMKSRDAS